MSQFSQVSNKKNGGKGKARQGKAKAKGKEEKKTLQWSPAIPNKTKSSY